MENAVDRSILPASELARRRAAARRLGWTLGAIALAIYLAGLYLPR